MDANNESQTSRWVDERLAALAPHGEWQPDTVNGLARLRAKRGAAGSPRARRWMFAAAVAVAACLCLVALPAPRTLAQRCVDCSVAIWDSLSASAPVRADVKPEKDRKLAPDFTLEDAGGKSVKLSDFRGKVVLLNFWATWCHGCKIEIPWFIGFQQAYRERDFVVLGVAFDADGWKSVRPYMEEKKVNYRMMLGNDAIADLYGGLQGLPETYVIDRAGRIAATHVGLITESGYRAEIEALLDEQPRDLTK
jgi:peroxiredoxin